MSNLVFPSAALPGLDISVTRTPVFETKIVQTLSGKELRSTWSTYPRYRYTVSFELLRAAVAFLEFQKLFGFITRHLGSWDSFLFTDPEDSAPYASTGATGGSHYFGVGDGATLLFQLQRTLVADTDLAAALSRKYWPVTGDGYEPIFDLNGTGSIYVGGVLKTVTTDYTISAAGVVTFVAAPALNALLAWSGSFYRRVRFDTDAIPADRIVTSFWSAKSVPLISVKP